MPALADWLDRSLGLRLVSPWCRNIGNCAEEMYYALLDARRRGTRVLFLFPAKLPGRLDVKTANRELCRIRSPYSVRAGSLMATLACWVFTCLFASSRAWYLFQRKLLRGLARAYSGCRLPPFDIWRTVPRIGRSALWKPAAVHHLDWSIVQQANWPAQHDRPLEVSMEPASIARAEMLREQMGIPRDAWFASVHVREGGFHQDHEFANSRNSSIDNYLPAIRRITGAGGWVVRLGDASMQRLPAMPRVIDYPHTTFKCPELDVYLVSQCRFFVGVPSGMFDLAYLFQRPLILTNGTEWSLGVVLKTGDLFIPKHVFSKRLGRYLSLKEMLATPLDWQSFSRPASDYELTENTADEIAEGVEEFLTRSGAELLETSLQQEFRLRRSAQLRSWLEAGILPPELGSGADATELYRIAARATVNGTVGRHYLERNWDQDAMNPGCSPEKDPSSQRVRRTTVFQSERML